MSDLQEIAAFDSAGNALFAQAILEEQGIFSAMNNQNGLQLLRPLDRVGACLKILVKEEDSAEAIQILMDHELIQPDDLGPDKLAHALNENFSQGMVGAAVIAGEKIWIAFIIGLGVLITILLIFGSGGGKF